MSNIVKFSARGTTFNIPLVTIHKKPKSLMYILCTTPLPTDKIDHEIMIDVDPKHMCHIIDYYNLDVYPDMQNNPYLYMDFNYLGLIDNEHKNISCIPFYMKYPLTKSHNDSQGLCQQLIEYKKNCRIHTIDNKIVVVNLASYNTTIYCGNDHSEFTQIIFGMKEEHIINISEEYIAVWIGLSRKMVNNILSVIRDGICLYYEFLARHDSQHSKNVIKYLHHFGICDTNMENKLNNRINIVKDRFSNFVANDGSSYFFSEDEIKSRTCFLEENSQRSNDLYYLFYKVYRNTNHCSLYHGYYFDSCKSVNYISHTLCEKLEKSLVEYIIKL